jgi:hypothetical protein
MPIVHPSLTGVLRAADTGLKSGIAVLLQDFTRGEELS